MSSHGFEESSYKTGKCLLPPLVGASRSNFWPASFKSFLNLDFILSVHRGNNQIRDGAIARPNCKSFVALRLHLIKHVIVIIFAETGTGLNRRQGEREDFLTVLRRQQLVSFVSCSKKSVHTLARIVFGRSNYKPI
jgi:hypothetical protein